MKMASCSVLNGLLQRGRAGPTQCAILGRLCFTAAITRPRLRPCSSCLPTRPSGFAARSFSARVADLGKTNVEHVFVPCASSGSIIVSLYNVSEHQPTTPLLLHLPPTPQPHIEDSAETGSAGADIRDLADDLAAPPDFLLQKNFPIATIRYRWSAADVQGHKSPDAVRAPSHLWPTPLHDVIFAYHWIKKYLSPPLATSDRSQSPDGRRHYLRRDLYVYGSHLGASLATALALTETHPQQRVAVRGVAAYNGIYNWTAFVGVAADGIPLADDAAAVQAAAPGTPPLASLFNKPVDLFDSFVSPSLFFHTAGHLLIPADFDRDVSIKKTEEAEILLEEREEREARNDGESAARKAFSMQMLGLTRKAYIAFPPLRSTLSIPSTLLLHTSAPAQPSTSGSRSKRPKSIPEAVNGNNSFAIQADELASLMRRGIDKVEIKRKREREPILLPEYDDGRKDDSGAAQHSKESEQRVRFADVGASKDNSLELNDNGRKMLLDWLDEHMNRGSA